MLSQVQEGLSFRESWCSDTPEQWDRDLGSFSGFWKDEAQPGGSAQCVQDDVSHQGGCVAQTRVLW